MQMKVSSLDITKCIVIPYFSFLTTFEFQFWAAFFSKQFDTHVQNKKSDY